MRGTWVALLLAGCMNHTYDTRPAPGSGSGSDPLPVDHSDPHSCEQTATLVGEPMTDLSQSFALALDSVGWCLTLDATHNLQQAHFMAGSPIVHGTSSGVVFTLLDAATVTTLVDGWDVSVGQTDTTTSANLEYSVPAGQTQTVILRMRAVDDRTDTLGVSLFEPLEQ
jgi:hypothetical protein